MNWHIWMMIGLTLIIVVLCFIVVRYLNRIRDLYAQIVYLQRELGRAEQARDRERKLANENAASTALLAETHELLARVLVVLHALRDEGLMPQGIVPIWLQAAIVRVEQWFHIMIPQTARQEKLLAAAYQRVAQDLPMVAAAHKASRRAAG